MFIPDGEYTLAWVRSPGPGGQNVNKVATACELRFFVAGTSLLDEDGRRRLRSLAGRRLTRRDEILIEAHRHRSREDNRRDALARLAQLIAEARRVPKVRRKTAAPARVRAGRLQGKKMRKEIKRLRARPAID
jgi:ribosome-associated protein